MVFKKVKQEVKQLIKLNTHKTFLSLLYILDVVAWGLDYVMDIPKLEKREGEEEEGARNCFCESPLTCICCMDFNLTFVNLGGPGCVRMKYLRDVESMAVNISYGDSVLHSEMVKGPNPEPTCMNIFTEWAQFCARFRDLGPTESGMKACLQFEPVLLGQVQTQYQVGCFETGPDGINFDSSATPVAEDGIALNSTYPGAAGSEEGLSEAELIAAVNESAEDGIAFFSNLLGLNFGESLAGSSQNNTNEAPSTSDTLTTPQTLLDTSRKD
ncbi:hypothetical protein J437_LFUL009378 [Ladona fulva]|uniref:DUF4773 domain-containing protein n=1 Tax=Ladona fulva TaxID=123851 RepID=A0A8K0P0N9_LADFU|nr:hypothetical protein J437_LFUL009378 [Ladona fulva]